MNQRYPIIVQWHWNSIFFRRPHSFGPQNFLPCLRPTQGAMALVERDSQHLAYSVSLPAGEEPECTICQNGLVEGSHWTALPCCLSVAARTGACPVLACSSCYASYIVTRLDNGGNTHICVHRHGLDPDFVDSLPLPVQILVEDKHNVTALHASDSGCGAVVPFAAVGAHLAVCPRALVRCPVYDCNAVLPRAEMEAHAADESSHAFLQTRSLQHVVASWLGTFGDLVLDPAMAPANDHFDAELENAVRLLKNRREPVGMMFDAFWNHPYGNNYIRMHAAVVEAQNSAVETEATDRALVTVLSAFLCWKARRVFSGAVLAAALSEIAETYVGDRVVRHYPDLQVQGSDAQHPLRGYCTFLSYLVQNPDATREEVQREAGLLDRVSAQGCALADLFRPYIDASSPLVVYGVPWAVARCAYTYPYLADIHGPVPPAYHHLISTLHSLAAGNDQDCELVAHHLASLRKYGGAEPEEGMWLDVSDAASRVHLDLAKSGGSIDAVVLFARSTAYGLRTWRLMASTAADYLERVATCFDRDPLDPVGDALSLSRSRQRFYKGFLDGCSPAHALAELAMLTSFKIRTSDADARDRLIRRVQSLLLRAARETMGAVYATVDEALEHPAAVVWPLQAARVALGRLYLAGAVNVPGVCWVRCLAVEGAGELEPFTEYEMFRRNFPDERAAFPGFFTEEVSVNCRERLRNGLAAGYPRHVAAAAIFCTAGEDGSMDTRLQTAALSGDRFAVYALAYVGLRRLAQTPFSEDAPRQLVGDLHEMGYWRSDELLARVLPNSPVPEHRKLAYTCAQKVVVRQPPAHCDPAAHKESMLLLQVRASRGLQEDPNPHMTHQVRPLASSLAALLSGVSPGSVTYVTAATEFGFRSLTLDQGFYFARQRSLGFMQAALDAREVDVDGLVMKIRQLRPVFMTNFAGASPSQVDEFLVVYRALSLVQSKSPNFIAVHVADVIECRSGRVRDTPTVSAVCAFLAEHHASPAGAKKRGRQPEAHEAPDAKRRV